MNELLQIARYHRPMPGCSAWFWLHKNRDLCRCLPRTVRRQGWLIYVRAGRGRSHKGRQVIYVRRLMDLLVCAETCEKMIFHDSEHRGAESTDDGWPLCGTRCGHLSCSSSRRSSRSRAQETAARTALLGLFDLWRAERAFPNGVLRSNTTIDTNN